MIANHDAMPGSLQRMVRRQPTHLTLGGAENPAGQAKCSNDTADSLNEKLGVSVLDKRTAKEEKRASQNDDGCADMLTSA